MMRQQRKILFYIILKQGEVMNKRISTIIFIILVVLLCVPVLTSMLYKFGVNKFYKACLDVKYKANLEYIKNFGFWSDIKIMFQTVLAVIKK